MSHGSDAERDRLLAALDEIQGGLCPFCETSKRVVRWTGTRWQIRILCHPRCRSTRTLWHRLQARELVYALLEFYGPFLADYGEDDLVRHVKVMVIG